MKTNKELNALKKVKALNNKLRQLTVEELVQVIGGIGTGKLWPCPRCGQQFTASELICHMKNVHKMNTPDLKVLI